MGEFELIRRYFDRGGRADARQASSVRLGIGDDCALLAVAGELAVSTDMLVDGRHFFSDVDPAALGFKALAVNLSDLAAMGARPFAFVLALALPAADEHWLASFAHGLFDLADRFDCVLAGGDTTRGPLNICITIFGEIPAGQSLRRDGAVAGDDLWVSGALGAAAYAVHCRLAGSPLPHGHAALQRLERPEPRVGLGLRLRGVASAAIDLSDGLHGDAGHIAERSSVSVEIDLDALPVDPLLAGLPVAEQLHLALAGGDDYEIAFTAPPSQRDHLEMLSRDLGLPLTRAGRIVPRAGAPGVLLKGPLAAAVEFHLQAYDHFRNPG